jgi:hypothetical protein
MRWTLEALRSPSGTTRPLWSSPGSRTPAARPRLEHRAGRGITAGDAIPLGGRTIRVVDVRDDDEDDPVLVVQDLGE